MPTTAYGKLEEKVIDIFREEGTFFFSGVEYAVEIAGKPRSSYGECKTDAYILGLNPEYGTKELKISVKTAESNEFQENKMNAKRAEEYFGTNWSEIISSATRSIQDKFESTALVYPTRKHPVKEDSITLGWKLEIANRPRALSVKAPLSDDEIRSYVYMGTNQNEDKRNALVGGSRIPDAGIADYLLTTSLTSISSTSDVIDQMQRVETVKLPDIYLIFTANNYRTQEDKADGPRPLAVYIKWSVENGRLTPHFVYDEPLKYTGEEDIKPILIKALKELGKEHPSGFMVSDVAPKYMAE